MELYLLNFSTVSRERLLRAFELASNDGADWVLFILSRIACNVGGGQLIILGVYSTPHHVGVYGTPHMEIVTRHNLPCQDC